jgi:hypothetical protein
MNRNLKASARNFSALFFRNDPLPKQSGERQDAPRPAFLLFWAVGYEGMPSQDGVPSVHRLL